MSEEESLVTEAMVKKATYLIHKLADQRNEPFETIRSKCKKMFGYMNLAKLSLEDGHAMISTLIELTGGVEEKPQLPTKPDDKLKNKDSTVKDDLTHEKTVQKPTEKEEETKTEEDVVTATMRASVRAAVNITLKEIVAKEVPVQGLGGVVLEISKVIFEAKMSEEAA
jgi:hypothetical protein